jgi:predicted MFS family arabinose efflux permease
VVREKPTAPDRAAFRATWVAARSVLADRSVWLVPGFVVLFTFSPSFGPAFLFYETDDLRFDQQFIGLLTSINSAASVAGALIYAPLSRTMSLRRLINLAIGLAVLSTLAYLLYRSARSAVAINLLWGSAGMIAQLALLDLAAKACPERIEATFFALMMSLINLANQASQSVGAHMYTALGQGQSAYTLLVLVSAATKAAVWLLVPLVRIERIEAQAVAAIARDERVAT